MYLTVVILPLLGSIVSGFFGAVWSRKSLMCLQLSNFGNALKLLVPGDGLKAIRGWNNYSCKVISQKIDIIDTLQIIPGLIPELKNKQRNKSAIIRVINNIHKEILIGYRESKSMILPKNTIVKEQRAVDSGQSMRNNYFCLRCALMGFEINYRIRIPFNQINKRTIRSFSSNVIPQQQNFSLTHKMDPSFITGFVDGEGCFTLIIVKRSRVKVGWEVQLFFQIILHNKDKWLLEQIQSYFAVGRINKCGTQSIRYRVSSIEDLIKIIDHFEKFPLISSAAEKNVLIMTFEKKHII